MKTKGRPVSKNLEDGRNDKGLYTGKGPASEHLRDREPLSKQTKKFNDHINDYRVQAEKGTDSHNLRVKNIQVTPGKWQTLDKKKSRPKKVKTLNTGTVP